jgi:hypothetical protein
MERISRSEQKRTKGECIHTRRCRIDGATALARPPLLRPPWPRPLPLPEEPPDNCDEELEWAGFGNTGLRSQVAGAASAPGGIGIAVAGATENDGDDSPTLAGTDISSGIGGGASSGSQPGCPPAPIANISLRYASHRSISIPLSISNRRQRNSSSSWDGTQRSCGCNCICSTTDACMGIS